MVGGSDYKDSAAKILQTLMTDCLASQFCWEGIRKVNSKRAFKNLKIQQAVFGKKSNLDHNCF
jgi:hypothetical protein